MNIVDKIVKNFNTNKNLYIGEKVTISEHMIQTAMLAEENNCSKSLICASLLHDYGHFIVDDPDLFVSKSQDAKHEDLGFNFLHQFIPFLDKIIIPFLFNIFLKLLNIKLKDSSQQEYDFKFESII